MKKELPKSVLSVIEQVKEKFSQDPETVELFINCYTNTLDTTVKRMEDGTTHVITGDIPAMWLRDSAAQVRPYLILGKEDKEIGDMLVGLVKRQMFFVGIDAYANAFNMEPGESPWTSDETKMNPWLWERKYEIDSLCYPIQLSYLVWKNTGRTDQFDENYVKGVKRILEVWRTEQNHEENSTYSFIRRGYYFTDTLSREGKGALVRPNTGLIWSGFRPSDDACVYGYFIPANMFAVVVLGYLEEIAEQVLGDEKLKEEAAALKREVYETIETLGILHNDQFGDVYAYEVDGYGQYLLMDDANVPSLLSMSYLGYKGKNIKTQENTRRMILSDGNPYYYKGKAAKGIGSPHTPVGYIWHIALCMQGMTATEEAEKYEILETIKRTHGGKKMMHEGFSVEDPTKYTREWFSWANAMFCEFVMDLCGIHVKK